MDKKMPEIKIGGRNIPLYYSTYETIAIQREIGCTAFQLNEKVFGVETIDELFNMISLKGFSPEEQKMRFAVMDTMGDAILNVLGALPMYLFLRKRPYRHSGKRDVNRQIEEMLAAEQEKETVSV